MANMHGNQDERKATCIPMCRLGVQKEKKRVTKPLKG